MSENRRRRTRRAILGSAGVGLALGLAGCTGLGTDANSSPTARASPSATETPTNAASETPGESATETADEGPGYKSNHWHGRLFFEVNGELVDFAQPKYYLKNIEDDRPETVYFHFHVNDENHAPGEWSNEKKVVTLKRGLNLLPGISYKRQSGAHVVTFEGTTYDGGDSGTEISITESGEPINPSNHQVAHDDIYYVQIVTEDTKRSAQPAHSGADLGTLWFELNNVRIDFSRKKYLGPEAASETFHFHDDGNPLMWYLEGSTTLADALNSLPGIGYEKRSGSHVVEFQDEQRSAYSRTYDSSSPEHEITVWERTTPIDPTNHQLKAGDIIWLHVQSSVIPSNEH